MELVQRKIDITRGTNGAMEVGRHAAGNQVAHPVPIQKPAHPQRAVLFLVSTTGCGGHASTVRTR